ncbi:MAG: hypothetical protein KDD44_10205 [Bdellovibrionales bacterium]|nr:hypothetical protein [Bdellovibrionales bacterium]
MHPDFFLDMTPEMQAFWCVMQGLILGIAIAVGGWAVFRAVITNFRDITATRVIASVLQLGVGGTIAFLWGQFPWTRNIWWVATPDNLAESPAELGFCLVIGGYIVGLAIVGWAWAVWLGDYNRSLVISYLGRETAVAISEKLGIRFSSGWAGHAREVREELRALDCDDGANLRAAERIAAL